jgi:phosphatidylinositol kinase/protein kinase (PI-3  family)
MKLMRKNYHQIIGLLEVFIYDPLLQWMGEESGKSDEIVRRISDKLCGVVNDRELAVEEQVDQLVVEATSTENLSQMFRGWAPWL